MKTKKTYLACSMNFSRLFCITFSKNLNLLTRASLSSDVLQSDAGFCSCEETSPVALFGFCCSESSSETLWLPAASCVSALCSIFSVQFARPAKPTASRRGPKVVLAHAQWRPLGHDLKSQLSLLLKVAAVISVMGLITGVCAFLYHLPQIYKWLLKPYYLVSFFMTIAFLVVRKAPGLCEHLATEREDGNSCDFDWVRAWRSLQAHNSGLVQRWPH